MAQRLGYSRKMWWHLRIYWRFYQFFFLYWLHLEVFRWLVIYPKKRDTPAYFNNIHAFSKNIITNNFFYLPYFSSSLLNGTLLIILKLKLRWDSACTEDAREYFFCCDDTDNIILEWTLFQVIVSALISSWPDRFSVAKLKCTMRTLW